MSEVELRFNLLTEARSTLFRHWEEKVAAEKSAATFENRPHRVVSPPTIRKIMKVAAEMYEFVNPTGPNPTAPSAS